MRNLKAIISILLAAFCCHTSSFAVTLTVKKDGSGDFINIQAAIDAATQGDEIIVHSGLYVENINFDGKNINLRSTEPTSDTIVQTTIIDGIATSAPVVTFSGSEGGSCVLSGFTITNGTGYYWERYRARYGGGIYGDTCRATIENNIIISNTASGGGGVSRCYGTIQNNRIYGNSASMGGGLGWCNGTIQKNMIYGNSASGGGGLSWCDGTIQNNLIFRNNDGGLFRCNATIQNNTICLNTVSDSRRSGGLYWSNGMIKNCIIWGNIPDQLYTSSNPDYSCIQNWSGGGTGNISKDPLFVDPENNDFYLLPDSPCIDSGAQVNLAEDFDGHRRPYDGTYKQPRGDGSDFDIGAYEYLSPVDLFALEIAEYLIGIHTVTEAEKLTYDTNQDGRIDVADIIHLLNND